MNSADLPSSIGEYDILGEIARGSVGVVYKARHRELDRFVALKVVHEDEVEGPTDLERFLRGARAAARLNHPHIVQIYEVGRVADAVFCAMALIEGPSLRQRLRQGPLPAAQSRRLIETLAAAVSHAHAQGVVHRDLNPDSILFDASGLPRITGFGTARLTHKGQSLTTASGAASFETAPEFVTGQGDTSSPSVDVYGLGTVLYSALTGKTVFADVAVAELPVAISDSIPPAPRKTNPKVSKDLDEVCRRCLAKEPSDRYSTVADISSTLAMMNPVKTSKPAGSQNHVGANRPWFRLSRLAVAGLTLIVGSLATLWLTGRFHFQPATVAQGAPPLAVAPFSEQQALAHQEAWAKYLGVPVEHENQIGMTFRLIPPGEFDMGETPEEVENHLQTIGSRFTLNDDWNRLFRSALPKQRVRISRPFYLGKFEVTFRQFSRFVQETGYVTDAENASGGGGALDLKTGNFTSGKEFNWKNTGFTQGDQHPVINFSYNDATAFCEWLSKTEDRIYRLPTEAEWEYAARAGTIKLHYSGADVESLKGRENLPDESIRGAIPFYKTYTWMPWNDGFVFTAPVGSFPPNPFGLHDVLGNTSELIADWFDPDYYSNTPLNDPAGPNTGGLCIFRGGGFEMNCQKELCNTSVRGGFYTRSDPNIVNGMRLVVEIPTQRESSAPFHDADELDSAAKIRRAEALIDRAKLLPMTEEIAGAWAVEVWRQALNAAKAAISGGDRVAAEKLAKRAEEGLARTSDQLTRLKKESVLWGSILAADNLATARAEPNDSIFDAASATQQFARLFQAFGYEADQSDGEVLSRLLEDRPAVVKNQVIDGLQLWEIYADAAGQPAVAEKLRNVQTWLDENPWRIKARSARAIPGANGILAIAEATAKTSAVVEQHELLARVILARGLTARPEALAFFRESAKQFPDGFWSSLGLGLTLMEEAKRQNGWEAQSRQAELSLPSLHAAMKARPDAKITDDQIGKILLYLNEQALPQANPAELELWTQNLQLLTENDQIDERIRTMSQSIESSPHRSTFERWLSLGLSDRSRDRRVAEWVIKSGGTVQLWQPSIGDWGRSPVRSLASLPTSVFHVSGVSLDDSSVTDTDLARLARLPHLEVVSLAGTNVTDDGLRRWCSSIKRLNSLNLERTTISDALLGDLPEVVELLIRKTKTTAEGIVNFKRLRTNAFVRHASPMPKPTESNISPNKSFALSFDDGSRVVATIDIPEGSPLTYEALALPQQRLGCRMRSMIEIIGLDSRASQRLNFLESRQLHFESWDGTYSSGLSPAQMEVDIYDRPTHFAAVTENQELRFYINGQKVASQALRPIQLNRQVTVNIGGTPVETFRQFYGLIDEVRVSSVARYSDNFTPQTRHEPDEHTRLLYHFDEGEGDVARDSSGYDYHGRIVGAQWVREGEAVQFEQAKSLIIAAARARQKKQYPEALALLREALALQPDLASGKVELAATLILDGQEIQAELLLQEMLKPPRDEMTGLKTIAAVCDIVEPQRTGEGLQDREPNPERGRSNRIWQSLRKYRPAWGEDAPIPAIAPFNAEQARKYQTEWAAYLNVPVEYTNSMGMKFRLIPPGEFLMGSTSAEIQDALQVEGTNWAWCINSEVPRRTVILTRPYFLGVLEATQGQYERVMGTNPSGFHQSGERKNQVEGLDTSHFPVETVNWNDAVEFCKALNRLEFPHMATSKSIDRAAYRLPTEAEWEFACRAGTITRYFSGETDQSLTTTGWFIGNSGQRAHASGELSANPFGLYDMHGNVWECVLDQWGLFQVTSEGEFAIDPLGPQSGNAMLRRGGSWSCNSVFHRSSSRNSMPIASRICDIGFRVFLSVDAVRAASASKTP